MHSAIVFTYSRPHAGREREAWEAFSDALTFFGKLAADGVCAEPEVFLGPFAKGIMIVKGDLADLRGIIDSDDFGRFYLKTTFSVPDIGFELFAFGDGVSETMGTWSSVGSELGFM